VFCFCRRLWTRFNTSASICKRKKKREDAFLRGVCMLVSYRPLAHAAAPPSASLSNRALQPAGVADNWREASQAATPASASVASSKPVGKAYQLPTALARDLERARAAQLQRPTHT